MSTANQSSERPPRDGTAEVRVAPDRMSARLLVQPPEPGGRPATAEQAMLELTKAGVTCGIDPEAVRAAVRETGPADRTGWVDVARGQPPAPGEDARIEYHPLLLERGGRPRQREDGGADLFDLGLVRNVPRGTVLATKQPARPGTPGTNVLGEAVPPPAPRDLPLRAGKGTVLGADGLQTLAAVDGHAVLVHGEVRVSDVYVVKEDVGTATGHIAFVGSVVVHGNVHPGFRVRAEQDVEIRGGVEGGSVEAGGSVLIRYGLQGAGQGRVQAGRNLRCLFIQSAEAVAGGDVTVPDGIVHSQVQAGGKVEVQGRRGAIMGGRVQAGTHVRTRMLGTHAGTPTEVACGMAPEVRRELAELRHRIEEGERKLRSVLQALAVLRLQDDRGLLTPERQELLPRLVREEVQVTAELEAAGMRVRELEAAMVDPAAAWVEAETCFPGVRVAIGSARCQVADTLRRVRFTLNEAGEVTF